MLSLDSSKIGCTGENVEMKDDYSTITSKYHFEHHIHQSVCVLYFKMFVGWEASVLVSKNNVNHPFYISVSTL